MNIPFFPMAVIITVMFLVALSSSQPGPAPPGPGPGPPIPDVPDDPSASLGPVGKAAMQGIFDYASCLASNFTEAARMTTTDDEQEINQWLQGENKSARQMAFQTLDQKFQELLGDGKWTTESARKAYTDAAAGFGAAAEIGTPPRQAALAAMD